MGSLRKFDDWLLDRVFQPIAWRGEFYAGQNQFACARIALLVLLVGAWLLPETLEIRVIIGMHAVVLFWGAVLLERMESRSAGKGARNRLRIDYFPIRPLYMVFIILMPSFLAEDEVIATLISMLGMGSYFYFLSCDSMPPKWSEEKEAREAAKEAARLAPVKA